MSRWPSGSMGLALCSAEIPPDGLVKDSPRPHATLLLPWAGRLHRDISPALCPLHARKPRLRSSAPCGQQSLLGSPFSLEISQLPAGPLHYLPMTKPLRVRCLSHSVLPGELPCGPTQHPYTALGPAALGHVGGAGRRKRGAPPCPAQPLLLPWLVSGLEEGDQFGSE